jgi:predicted DNA binding protein
MEDICFIHIRTHFLEDINTAAATVTAMATIIEAMIPTEEFALAETLQTCGEATVECEQIVEHPDNTVMPLVWVRTTSPDAFEAALAQDPTVETYTQLAETPTECLYEMHWGANIQLVLQCFTMEGAVILDTIGNDRGWHLRVLFPDRDDVRATSDFCETHNLTLTMHRIRQLDDDTARQGSARFGLTPDQHEALTCAYKQGYFRVPRDIDLDDLADGLDISHQALSERLRRGHETLIGKTLESGTDPAMADHQSTASAARRADEPMEADED